jgi:uncharacterized protein YqjF (DUF2071 family)
VLHQRWHDLAFLHWPFAPAALRPLVPPGLELDIFDGRAWVGITPFRISRMRPAFVPALPGISRADEINVRIYVHRGGIPGIWFPSLDITNRIAMWGARIAYRLPYFHARMYIARRGGVVDFHSERTEGRPAMLDLEWQVGDPLPVAAPDSLEFFLTERYVLYAGEASRLLRARIHHRPWPLAAVTVRRLESTLLEAAGMATPTEAPLVHAQAEPFDIEVWLPVRA